MSLHACKYTYRRPYIQTFRYITHLLRYTLTYMHANRQADTFRQTPTGENMYACVNLKNTFMFCTKKHTDDEYIHPSKTISAHAWFILFKYLRAVWYFLRARTVAKNSHRMTWSSLGPWRHNGEVYVVYTFTGYPLSSCSKNHHHGLYLCPIIANLQSENPSCEISPLR